MFGKIPLPEPDQLPQRILITSTPYLLSYHLPSAVQEFAAAHPAVRLNLHVAIQQADVLQRVDRGEADLGITGPRSRRGQAATATLPAPQQIPPQNAGDFVCVSPAKTL